jgi:hypothetical protein
MPDLCHGSNKPVGTINIGQVLVTIWREHWVKVLFFGLFFTLHFPTNYSCNISTHSCPCTLTSCWCWTCDYSGFIWLVAINLVYWHWCRLSSIKILACYTKFYVMTFNPELPPSNTYIEQAFSLTWDMYMHILTDLYTAWFIKYPSTFFNAESKWCVDYSLILFCWQWWLWEYCSITFLFVAYTSN